MTGYSFSRLLPEDETEVIDIFNYYIANSFAAFPSQTVPYEFFNLFLAACKDYPSVVAKEQDGKIAGFGLLRFHNMMPAFSRTAEVSYFVRPGCTGKGLGTQMLKQLEKEGKSQEISVILACISSLNEGSIRFHEKNGFVHCGQFKNVAVKNGVVFDTVWMQKFI
ncbi:MAG TPA: N-acetyltransferase family protein [Methanoregula sp.]|nr:N-acetyltransferase family protein [Methanoregula sp.]